MGRPKRVLTQRQAYLAYRYFERLLERVRGQDGTLKNVLVMVEGVTPWNAYYKASEALKALPDLSDYQRDPVTHEWRTLTEDEMAPACAAFRAWLDEYVTEAGWRRFLANARQEDFKHAKKPVALKVSPNTYYSLKFWAEKQSLTLDKAVATLVKHAVQLPEKTYYDLQFWAEKQSLTSADAIAKLLRQAEEREALAKQRR